MRERDKADQFEMQLETHLQHWRDVTPPPHLQSRVAAAVAPRHRFYLRPLLAGGLCAAALGLFFMCPGSPVQPAPAFAEVERAMKSVESITFTRTIESEYSDGAIERETGLNWIRLHPPTIALESVTCIAGKELRKKMLSDEKQTISFDQFHGEPGKWKVYPPQSDIALDVKRTHLIYVHPGGENPLETERFKQRGVVLPPWQSRRAVQSGKPVWVFTRTFLYNPDKPQHGIGMGERTVVRLTADAKTRRVIRQDMFSTYAGSPGYRHLTLTNFRYNEPAPPNLRNIHLPKEMTR